MNRLGRLCAGMALLSITALTAAGCGGEKTDVSGGIDSYNERFTQQGIPAKLECPDEVDGGEGTEFECTLQASEGDKNAKITMEIRKEGDDLVVIEKDQQALERAINEVAGQPGGGQQGGQQPGGQAPGGQAPGGQAPGGQAPGGQAPGGQAPGGQAPGGQQPEQGGGE